MEVFDLLRIVYGARGLPFPSPPKQGDKSVIAATRPYGSPPVDKVADKGSPIRVYSDEHLGTYQFLPASITWYNSATKKNETTDLPNALVIISGEKEIVETTIVDVGTVFEQVFIKPYRISIIITLIGESGWWPEAGLTKMQQMWRENQVVTLHCALTDVFLNKQLDGRWVDTPENNFIMQRISVLDNQGAENVEVIQIDGMSNIEFELEIV